MSIKFEDFEASLTHFHPDVHSHSWQQKSGVAPPSGFATRPTDLCPERWEQKSKIFKVKWKNCLFNRLQSFSSVSLCLIMSHRFQSQQIITDMYSTVPSWDALPSSTRAPERSPRCHDSLKMLEQNGSTAPQLKSQGK